MSEKVEWIEWPTFVEEGGGIRRATNAEVLREFNRSINEIADLRAQLAQREGELEALRAAYKEADEVADWALDQASQLSGYQSHLEPRILKMYDRLIAAKESLAALSDNPESPALTDQEEGE